MITIDIYVPVIGKTYDFSLDENTRVETVTEEIVELIIQKEGCDTQDASDMFLFPEKESTALNINCTLKENGVETGDKLLLI